MEYRQFGGSGLRVPVLSLGTATFGGTTEFFKAWGSTDVAGAKRLVHLCLEAGVNFFDTANVYSNGRSEEILGSAIADLKRDDLLRLRRFDSDLEGHPTPRLPFVDVATGSLGQGICAAVGIALGLGGAIGAASLMGNLLFGVQAWDLWTLAAVSSLLCVSALAASFVPARRAALLNPIEALRAE